MNSSSSSTHNQAQFRLNSSVWQKMSTIAAVSEDVESVGGQVWKFLASFLIDFHSNVNAIAADARASQSLSTLDTIPAAARHFDMKKWRTLSFTSSDLSSAASTTRQKSFWLSQHLNTVNSIQKKGPKIVVCWNRISEEGNVSFLIRNRHWGVQRSQRRRSKWQNKFPSIFILSQSLPFNIQVEIKFILVASPTHTIRWHCRAHFSAFCG